MSCLVPGCVTKHYGKGLCQPHYARWYYRGEKLIDGIPDICQLEIAKIRQFVPPLPPAAWNPRLKCRVVPTRHAANQRRYRTEARLAAYNKLGNICLCCGETRIEFLTIDHVNGNGQEDRKNGPQEMMLRIINSQDVSDWRILCFNCNLALSAYGYCPHQLERVVFIG